MGIIDKLKRLIMKKEIKSEDKVKETNEVASVNEGYDKIEKDNNKVSIDNNKDTIIEEKIEESKDKEIQKDPVIVDKEVEKVDDFSKSEEKLEEISKDIFEEKIEVTENKNIQKTEESSKEYEVLKDDSVVEDKVKLEQQDNTELENNNEVEIDIEEKINGELMVYRQNKSKEENKVAHFVLKNKEIEDIVKVKPKTIEEFKSINGIGKVKCEKYGEDIIKIVKKYC